MTSTLASTGSATPVAAPAQRITSIDALRGVVMFTMIFVNDLAGVSNKIVPPWMKHFHGRSGMTFVDLVFPAFLFIVGMSIPFALRTRSNKGESFAKVLLHVAARTMSLLAIGILMVNETPDSGKMGWSGELWSTLMFLAAIFAFCLISPRRKATAPAKEERAFRTVSQVLRLLGVAALVWLAFVFRGADGHRIISLAPFSIHAEWFGILGLMGSAYLAGSLVFLAFRNNRTAFLGSAVLLMCLYPADQTGLLNFWLARYVGIGEMLGSHASITVSGVLLASMFITLGADEVWARTRFTLSFISGFAAAALLLDGLYGINKNKATPSWCLWACAITAALWLVLYFLSMARPLGRLAKPLAIAGQNVFLAYLISEMLPSAIDLFHLGDWYDQLAGQSLLQAVARSARCAIIVLSASAGLNRLGFRLKL